MWLGRPEVRQVPVNPGTRPLVVETSTRGAGGVLDCSSLTVTLNRIKLRLLTACYATPNPVELFGYLTILLLEHPKT